MQIRGTIANEHVDADTLEAFAEANAVVAQKEIEAGKVPLASEAIQAGLVKWKPEDGPKGDESFDPPSLVLRRGWGDCDDLAPYHAASLRATGEDPEARPVVYQSGPSRWHVVTLRGDGSIDDPSRAAGMGRTRDGVEGIRPAVSRPLDFDRPTGNAVIGVKRVNGRWRARVDAPIDDVHGVAVCGEAADPLTAMQRACMFGVLAVWGAPDEVVHRIAAARAALRGELAAPEVHGDFVGAVSKQVAKMSIDPNAAANIAATIIDPLGLRNLAMPLAQSFMQGMQGGGVTATIKPKGSDAVSGRGSSGRGGRGDSGRGGRGGSSRGGRGGRGGGRGDSSQDQGSYDQPYTDPQTGFQYDAQSGGWWDPVSQSWVDPTTGIPYAYSMYQTPQMPAQYGYGYGAYGAYPQAAPQQGYGQYPGYGYPTGAYNANIPGGGYYGANPYGLTPIY